MDIIDVGSQARTGPPDLAPGQHLADLRATLLGGRGPGASSEEVAEPTRNWPWLGAVPALVERALVARQIERLRAGAPIVSRRGRRERRARSWRAVLLGATVALTARALMSRLAASRGQYP